MPLIEDGGSRVPFRDRIIDSEFSDRATRLQEFENDPTKIIRFLPIDVGPKKVNENQEFQNFRRGGELLRELPVNYDIAVAPFDMIVGENNQGQKGIFMIVDKIPGDNLMELLRKNPEAVPLDMLENHLLKLIAYYDSKVQDDTEVLVDLAKPSQYVYKKDAEKIILVDVDPYYDHPTERYHQGPRSIIVILKRQLLWISRLEDVLTNHLEKPRAAIQELLNKLSPLSESEAREINTFNRKE